MIARVPKTGTMNPSRYRRLVGKLNYLTVTRPDISFATSVVSRFLESPHTNHLEVALTHLEVFKESTWTRLTISESWTYTGTRVFICKLG